MKKTLIAAIAVVAIILLYVMTRDKQTAIAPTSSESQTQSQVAKSQPIESKQQEVQQEQTSQTTNQSTQEKKPMGLEIKTTKEGTGDRVIKNGDTISVHYTGKLTDGTKFDSSVDRGVPFEFKIGQGMVIQGWEQGFLGAKVGEKRTLTIPAELGYGSRGAGAVIPPNATLIFDVEVVAIK